MAASAGVVASAEFFLDAVADRVISAGDTEPIAEHVTFSPRPDPPHRAVSQHP
jgi:hypothetical protein